jgi:hypothetical protein
LLQILYVKIKRKKNEKGVNINGKSKNS